MLVHGCEVDSRTEAVVRVYAEAARVFLERDVPGRQSLRHEVEIGYADAESGEAGSARPCPDREIPAVAERVVTSVFRRRRAGECAKEAGMVFRVFRI